MKTTLNEIKKHNPCAPGCNTLLKGLGKTQADDDPLMLSSIAEINGVSDALWVCCNIQPGHVNEIKLFAIWCAEQVIPLMKDSRSACAVTVASEYVMGIATFEGLEKARNAAADAADAAASYATSYATSYAADAASYAAAAASYAADAASASYAAAAAAASYAADAAAYAATADAYDAAAYGSASTTMRLRQKNELVRVFKQIESEVQNG